MQVFGSVSDLECDVFLTAVLFPWVLGDEVEIVHREMVFVHFVGIIAVRHEENVALDVFLNNKPWTSAQSQSLALTDGVEPQPCAPRFYVLSLFRGCRLGFLPGVL